MLSFQTALFILSGVSQYFDRFLAWYFSLSDESQARGGDRLWRVEAAWNWQSLPTILLLLLVVVLTFWLTVCISRGRSLGLKGGLLSLRLSSLVLLALLIFQIQLKTIVYGRPAVAVLIDTSQSMSLLDRYSAKDAQALARLGVPDSLEQRLDLVKHLWTSQSSRWNSVLERQFDLRLYTFDTQLNQKLPVPEPASARPRSNANSQGDSFAESVLMLRANGNGTDLKSGLEELFQIHRDQPPVAVLLLSDGNPTAHGPQDLNRVVKLFERNRIPIFSIGFGARQNEKDLALEEVDYQPVGFVGDEQPVVVTVNSNPAFDSTLRIEIRNVVTGQQVAFANLNAIPSTRQLNSMLVIPTLVAGQNEFEIEISGLPGESNLQNNKQSLRIWGREADLRVLLVDQVPRWEFRHLKSTLDRDRHIALETFLIESDPAFAIEDRTARARLPESLVEYDALILGDLDFTLLDEHFVSEIISFVKEERGGLLLLSGQRALSRLDLASPLAEIHPALPQNRFGGERVEVHAVLSPEGKLQRLLPEGDEVYPVGQLPTLFPMPTAMLMKASAITLLQGELTESKAVESLPLILSMRYGSGLVIQHLFDDSWRWRSVQEGEFYRKMWSQLIRSLCRGKLIDQLPPLELFTSQDRYKSHESVQIQLVDRQNRYASLDQLTLQLSRDQTIISELPLQRSGTHRDSFSASVQGMLPGEYSAVLNDAPSENLPPPRVKFEIVQSDPETEYRPLNVALLTKLSDGTRGSFYYPWELEKLPSKIPGQQDSRSSQTRIIPLWNRWEILLPLIGLLSIEWILRRRVGIE